MPKSAAPAGTIRIAVEFSRTPGGRYRRDRPASAEAVGELMRVRGMDGADLAQTILAAR